MTDAQQPGGDTGGGYDPWAPPEHRTLADTGQVPGIGQPPQPSVHDQATVTSLPNAGFSAPAGDGTQLPPPPIAPTAPTAPAGYGYPGYPQGYGWPGLPPAPQNGMGVAAMVLGILACCLFCVYGVVSIILGILAIVFGVKGRRKAEAGLANNHGQALAGLITGIIGLFLGIAVVILMIVGITAALNEDDSDYEDPYYGAARSVAVSAPANA
jgi:hypothetical protein